GRGARLCREADQPHGPRGPRDGEGGAGAWARGAGWHAPADVAAQYLGDGVPEVRESGEDRHGPRLRPLRRRAGTADAGLPATEGVGLEHVVRPGATAAVQ